MVIDSCAKLGDAKVSLIYEVPKAPATLFF
jgi:hypothetical protein